MSGYSRVTTSTGPSEDSQRQALTNGKHQQHSFSNDNSLILISKVPTTKRDVEYAYAFIFVVLLAFILSFTVSPGRVNSTFLSYGKMGSWISMVMIATMLGTFLGMMISVGIYFNEFREQIMNQALAAAVFTQIGLAVIIFAADNWITLGVLCLLSAAVDCIKFRKAKQYMTISCELVGMAIDINYRFGASIVIFAMGIGAVQCCVLLWWSSAFVTLMSDEINTLVLIAGFVYLLLFYWIVQVFHSMVSCVVSGCVLWYFSDSDVVIEPTAASASTGAAKHVTLYAQCSISSSFGSICKAALFCPISHIIQSSLHWCREHDPFGGQVHSVLRTIISKVMILFEPFALRFNRLCLGYVAIYGYTVRHAADSVNREDINTIVLEDTTSYTLKTISTTLAGAVAIFLSIIGSREEGSSWPLFMLVCFLLAYVGVSLSLHCFRSAADALIIAYSDNPHKFEDMNTIIFHRFFRTTELPV